MCGIAGYQGDFDEALLLRMSASLAHRGPDDEGIFRAPRDGVGLAHRRLAILDLSPSGHQPMLDARGEVVLVYNGEIYNFRELRAELEREGVVFRGTSDTEVLLHLYLRDGPSMLSLLNGIFAFAIWDAREKHLFLARDPLGVKPLYYAETPKGFLFASELKALLQEPSLDRTLDLAAIHDTLSYLWCPAPATPLRVVRKLEPGTALHVERGGILQHWTFYELPYPTSPQPIGEEEAVERVREALCLAVRRQMVADVPVGAFLSGGLDSSSIVALAREDSSERLPCFTIELAGGNWEGFAEDLPYAKEVASKLDVELSAIRVEPAMMLAEVERMVEILDEPQADPAPLNVLFICRLAREHGIKVLLSGTGGDDLFSGYRRHQALMAEPLWTWLPRPLRMGLRKMAEWIPERTPWGRRLARAFRFADRSEEERIAGYFHWLSPTLQESLYGEAMREVLRERPFSAPLLRSLAKLPPEIPPLQKMLYLEVRHFLADHNLNYTDKTGMAVGVEVRVPFLDLDLVALAASLPPSLKQRGACGKWILKKAMEPYLPDAIIHRPKTGFGVPLRQWLHGPLHPLTEELLHPRTLLRRGIFDPAGVERLLALDRSGEVDATYPIFALMCVELWCRRFVDRREVERG